MEQDKCAGYEDLGKKVTCKDPKAFCYQEYYYRDMNYEGRAQTDVMKWDGSHWVQPDSPKTHHKGYETGIPAGSVWRGCRVPYDDVDYEETSNSHCQTFSGEWETNFNRYWLGSECYCDKDFCNDERRFELGMGTLAILFASLLFFNI